MISRTNSICGVFELAFHERMQPAGVRSGVDVLGKGTRTSGMFVVAWPMLGEGTEFAGYSRTCDSTPYEDYTRTG